MTTEEFESVVGDYFGDRVEFYIHEGEMSSVTFHDGIEANIRRFFPDDDARDGIFFLCDMWAGLDASEGISYTWAQEAVKRAREVQICKLLIDGSWDNGEKEDEDA